MLLDWLIRQLSTAQGGMKSQIKSFYAKITRKSGTQLYVKLLLGLMNGLP